jgi:uncharacterized protein YkwD
MSTARKVISAAVLALGLALPGLATASPVSTGAHKHSASCKHAKRKHKSACSRTSRKKTHKHGGTAAVSHVFSVLSAAAHVTAPTSASVVPASEASQQAVVAQVLDTQCQNTQLTPEEANLSLIAEATLCLVNQERARNDEQPLQNNSDLQRAAEGHSQDMIAEDYFAHVTPAGVGPAERIQQTGYIPANASWAIGENIAWATSYLATPEAIVTAWINSPEHLENILESKYRDSGIGVVAQAPASLSSGQPGAIYTQDFGVIEN